MGKWGSYAQSTKSKGGGGGGGLFLKIEDGQSVEFMVPPTSVPHRRYRRWLQGAGKYEDVAGPGEGVQERILLGVMEVMSGEAKVLEMAASTFRDLAGCLDHPKVGGTDQIYEIARTGQGKDTRWKIQRIDRAEPAQVAQCGRLSLPDLGQWADPIQASDPEPAPVRGRNAPKQPEPELDPDVPF